MHTLINRQFSVKFRVCKFKSIRLTNGLGGGGEYLNGGGEYIIGEGDDG